MIKVLIQVVVLFVVVSALMNAFAEIVQAALPAVPVALIIVVLYFLFVGARRRWQRF